MKQRLMKGNALRPTRAYEIETGYVVKSRLRFTAMTLFQKIIFGALIAIFAAIIYGDGLHFDTIEQNWTEVAYMDILRND